MSSESIKRYSMCMRERFLWIICRCERRIKIYIFSLRYSSRRKKNWTLCPMRLSWSSSTANTFQKAKKKNNFLSTKRCCLVSHIFFISFSDLKLLLFRPTSISFFFLSLYLFILTLRVPYKLLLFAKIYNIILLKYLYTFLSFYGCDFFVRIKFEHLRIILWI